MSASRSSGFAGADIIFAYPLEISIVFRIGPASDLYLYPHPSDLLSADMWIFSAGCGTNAFYDQFKRWSL